MAHFSGESLRRKFQALSLLAAGVARSRATLILLALFLCVVSFLLSLDNYWGVGDDALNLFMTGRLIANFDTGNAYLSESLKVLQQAGFREDGILSVAARQKNVLNYVFPSSAYRLVSAGLERMGWIDPNGHYPRFVAVSLFFGYVASFLAALAFFGTILFFLKKEVRLYVLYTICAVGLMIYVSSFFMTKPGYFRVSGFQSVWEFSRNFLSAFFYPGSTYGMFGPTPRNNLTLLVLGVGALRLSGRPELSYWFTLPAVLMHRQQGALLLASLLAMDILLRPRILIRPFSFVPAALALAYFAYFETFWQMVGLRTEHYFLLGISLLALVGLEVIPKPFSAR
ncbi:MAG: hypothetical protein ACE5JS_19950 [Nitrospinota bacterium]